MGKALEDACVPDFSSSDPLEIEKGKIMLNTFFVFVERMSSLRYGEQPLTCCYILQNVSTLCVTCIQTPFSIIYHVPSFISIYELSKFSMMCKGVDIADG
jgi:hypothetical protein